MTDPAVERFRERVVNLIEVLRAQFEVDAERLPDPVARALARHEAGLARDLADAVRRMVVA